MLQYSKSKLREEKQMKNLGSWLNWTFGVGLLSAFIFLSVFIFMRQKEKERTASNVEVAEKGQFLNILAMQNFGNGRMFWMQNIQTKKCFYDTTPIVHDKTFFCMDVLHPEHSTITEVLYGQNVQELPFFCHLDIGSSPFFFFLSHDN